MCGLEKRKWKKGATGQLKQFFLSKVATQLKGYLLSNMMLFLCEIDTITTGTDHLEGFSGKALLGALRPSQHILARAQ